VQCSFAADPTGLGLEQCFNDIVQPGCVNGTVPLLDVGVDKKECQQQNPDSAGDKGCTVGNGGSSNEADGTVCCVPSGSETTQACIAP